MKKIKNLLSKINPYLFVVIVLAAVLRFMGTDMVPPSLNWDEVSHGYNAYSLLTTGKDEWGVSYPVIFRAYGDYKLPVYIYLTAVSEKLFGLNEFAVRLPSIVAGVGVVIFTYLLVLELFKKKDLALLSAFLVAVEPGSLFLSRGAFEANLALFFIVSGTFLFIRSTENAKYMPLSMTLLGASVWTYNSARVFVPIMIFVLTLIYWKELKAKFTKHLGLLLFSVSILVLLFTPMIIQLLQPVGLARYGKVSIINDGAIAGIEEARNISKLPPILNRLVNNRITFFGKEFAENWISHFSASFLFFKGGSGYQFNVPGRGILYPLNIIPLIVGLLWLITKRSKTNTFILAWFLLSPIPSAITNEAPHVLRAIVTLPIPMIITAIGVFRIAEWLHKKVKVSIKLSLAVYIALLYLFLENYAVSYALEYREKYSWSWQYGYKQAVEYTKNHYFDYDKIIVTKKYGEPHEFFLFYWTWDPERFRSDPELIRFEQTSWYWVDRFDKFYFVNDWQIPQSQSTPWVLESGGTFDCTKTKCLLITSPSNYPKGWRLLETINFLDGKPAFEVITNIK
jgi:4-amino-4-deoxy-L-arabinose transferase-like glycosyltransferase